MSEKKETEWMEFDPKNDPRVKEVKGPSRVKPDGCVGSVIFGILFLALGLLALLVMAGI